MPKNESFGKAQEDFGYQKLDFEYFTAKSKVNFTDENQNVNASVNIRIRRDSLIWVSFRSTGIEGLRILFRTDSIFVVDRLEKVYYLHDYQKISDLIKFKVDFGMIQALIVGDSPFALGKNAEITKMKDHFLYQEMKGKIQIKNYLSRYHQRPTQLVLQEDENNLKVDYEDFKKINNQVLAHSMKAILGYYKSTTELKTNISLQHSQIELNTPDLKFPFQIPTEYKMK